MAKNFKNDPPKGVFKFTEIAETLGNIIVDQEPPFTVGIFGKWNSGKTDLLHRTQKQMKEMTRSGKKNDCAIKILSLLFRLLFFFPIINSFQKRKVKLFFVHISIVDYANSDQLWAAVVNQISKKVDEMFGSLAVKLFRAWHYKPEHLNVYLYEALELVSTYKSWKSPPLKVYLKPLLVVILTVSGIILWIVFGVPKSITQQPDSGQTAAITMTSLFGVGMLTKAKDIYQMISKLLFTQIQKIIEQCEKQNFTTSIGFIKKVKNEIYYLTAVVRYMGIFLDKEIRICLVIDDVDLLQKHQIMKLFQIVSLLQSSPNSVYIQILCMDPMITISEIKKDFAKEISSHVCGNAFLNKIIQLPFYIPKMKYDEEIPVPEKKHHYLKDTLDVVVQRDKSSLLTKKDQDYMVKFPSAPKNISHRFDFEVTRRPKIVEKLQERALYNHPAADYISGNQKTLKRILISSQTMIHIMSAKNPELLSQTEIKKLIAWVTLTDQWPYRISWIRQIIDDNVQSHFTGSKVARLISDSATLVDVYHVVEAKLCEPEDWITLLNSDSDPEMFIKFLQLFSFTVGDLKSMLPYTTNLNSSIHAIIGLCSTKNHAEREASFQLKERLMNFQNRNPLEDWTVDEVCFQLENMGLSKKNLEIYQKVAREKEITGEKLSIKSENRLQEELNMKPADWRVFWKTIRALRIFRGSEAVEED